MSISFQMRQDAITLWIITLHEESSHRFMTLSSRPSHWQAHLNSLTNEIQPKEVDWETTLLTYKAKKRACQLISSSFILPSLFYVDTKNSATHFSRQLAVNVIEALHMLFDHGQESEA